MSDLISQIAVNQIATKNELLEIIVNEQYDNELFAAADKVRQSIYGKEVYMRGLIEFTNYCKNDCFYCGIRHSNKNAERYRLTPKQIEQCAENGYGLGFRTFVLQGGEDPFYTDDVLCEIVKKLKAKYPDCAVTLSLGERSYDSFKALKDAGADRYLLRHETANKFHYEKLHPANMSFDNRIRCLYDLKSLVFQVGAGFMVGSPFQTTENLVDDLLFLKELDPHMVGIGPFIPHKDTPFANYIPFENNNEPADIANVDGNTNRSLRLTLVMVALTRLFLPNALIPATTALGTINETGRELGIRAGANVVMPNLSPLDTRNKYLLYDGKICTGDEAAECVQCMKRRMKSIGYNLVEKRGDYICG
ncbi:[FeFe] hydrogenase H-cluster radical SAM maturase HydE [Clostridia bacterium]|nr:[FeFe] hydrogenase H-cluster radical SAM maturase HydE [Clostridia bacterium]